MTAGENWFCLLRTRADFGLITHTQQRLLSQKGSWLTSTVTHKAILCF